MPIYENKLVNFKFGVILEIIIIFVVIALIGFTLIKNPKASFAMLLLGGIGRFIGDILIIHHLF